MGLAYNTSMVRDKLICHLDAANVKSYPETGTVFKSLTATPADFTIINAVHNSEGYFTFNGVDAEIWRNSAFPNFTPDNNTSTVCVLFRMLSSAAVNQPLFTDSYGPEYGIWYTPSNQVLFASYASQAFAYPLNTWCYAVLSTKSTTPNVTGTTTYEGYINGELVITGSAGTGNGLNDVPYRLGSDINTARVWSNCDIASLQVYDKQLSANEVRQNFEAIRGRVGL